MAWETRKGRKYLYRSRRTVGGVVKDYVGRGRLAEQVAQQVEERRRAAVEERSRLFDEQARLREVDTLVRQMEREIRPLIHAALTDAGLHQTASREWRKKRRSTCHGRQTTDRDTTG
jgi:hypothetical protein